MYSNFSHTLFNNKRLFLTIAKLDGGLPDLATTNVCKVSTSNINHIERSRYINKMAHQHALAKETAINNTLRN